MGDIIVILYLLQALQWPLSLNWRRGNDIPTCRLLSASSVVINGTVYCGGNDVYSNVVVQYNPDGGEWSQLPKSPVSGFALTSLSDQLVLVGGAHSDEKVRVWDCDLREWIDPYPPMPTGRAMTAALGYSNYLIVACGFENRSEVEVLDTSRGRWYRGQSVPVEAHRMSSAMVGDHWYLSSFSVQKNSKNHIFWAHLPTLISSSTLNEATTELIWHQLPNSPVDCPTLLGLLGHLLLVGGGKYQQEIHRYDTKTEQWSVCGTLPVGMGAPCCALLPSGDLMVAGGWTRDTRNCSKRVWLAKV